MIALLALIGCFSPQILGNEKIGEKSANGTGMICSSELDCLNGQCVFDKHSGTFCDCFVGWTGTYCDQLGWEKSANDTGMVCKSGLDCLNGLCVFDNHGGTFCDCFLGWNGTYCDQFSCEDSSACVNGVCNDGVFCLCHTGWTGRFCNESRGCNSDSCIHGDCVVSSRESTECKCDEGWRGSDCAEYVGCSVSGCGSVGSCVFLNQTESFCQCPEGFSGKNCVTSTRYPIVCASSGNLCRRFKSIDHTCSERTTGVTVQRRGRYDIEFNRTFSEYEKGFGDFCGEGDMWLGLDRMQKLTQYGRWTLQISMRNFSDNALLWGEWEDFFIHPAPFYNITFGKMVARSQNLRNTTDNGGGLDYNRGRAFSTHDRNQDEGSGNCAAVHGGGGWWFYGCSYIRLNGNRTISDKIDGYKQMSYYYSGRGWILLSSSQIKMIRVD